MRQFSPFGIRALVVSLAFLSLGGWASGQSKDFDTLKSQGEKYYREGSYRLAKEIYEKAGRLSNLSGSERRWAEFRNADTLWRSEAGSKTSDSSVFDQAQRALEVLIRNIQRDEEKDRVWLEVQESLGDFWWTRQDALDWNRAWPYYQAALEGWAGSKDVPAARERYLGIVWGIVEPGREGRRYDRGYYGNRLPMNVLENALRISQTREEKAHAHFLIARALSETWNYQQEFRVAEEYEAALGETQKDKQTATWYDEALYRYAEFLINNGRYQIREDGTGQRQPDYVKALALLTRLVEKFPKGTSEYHDQAKSRIEEITTPKILATVSNVFLPGSEIQFQLHCRNIDRVEFALYRMDLLKDIHLEGNEREFHEWISTINPGSLRPVKTWTKGIENRHDYIPANEAIRLDAKLPKGCYLLEAKGNGKTSRDILMVTDITTVIKASPTQILVFTAEAQSGGPVPGAGVKVWEQYYDHDNRWITRLLGEKKADHDGLCVFDIGQNKDKSSRKFFAAVGLADRQTFTSDIHSGGWRGRSGGFWQIYICTDRPAYRPGETAKWKVIARQYDGTNHSTPAHQTLRYRITDGKGNEVRKGEVKLNAFGSAWDSLELTARMTLGEYRVEFLNLDALQTSAGGTLFRLEEYKLPEFKVQVSTPEENGRKKSFRPGRRIEAIIQADYYFGGPVANATAEIVIYQKPFYFWWAPERKYPWCYEEESWRNDYGGQGQVVKREVLKTDSAGKATVLFDSSAETGQNLEYTIEARVRDSSRREITGTGTVRVTREPYYIFPRTGHYIYHPRDRVKVEINAIDANRQPVQVEGKVRVTRDSWSEVWIDPAGREVKGEEVKKLREKNPIFPFIPRSLYSRGWRLKSRGYSHEELLTQPVKTNKEGKAEFEFNPDREGYYSVEWTSRTTEQPPVRGQTAVWVTAGAVADLGYQPSGGVEIIADTDTFRPGLTAPVMLAVPTNGRYILFTVEGDDLYSYRVVHATGTVKLLEIPIEEKHVPNIRLHASMIMDHQFFADQKQIVVPPVRNFLEVEVKSDRNLYQPGEEGSLSVFTRNDQGKGVSAEVALGLVDESVYYIQPDYAGDPRAFYFGTGLRHQVQTCSGLLLKPYIFLVQTSDGRLQDEKKEDYQDQYGTRGFHYRTGGNALASGVPEIGDESEGAVEYAFKGPSKLSVRQNLVGYRGDNMYSVAPLARPMGKSEKPHGSAVQALEPRVRVDFRSTLFWQPDIMTDKDGKATVKVKFPDSLTTWKATARAVTTVNQFGMGSSTTRTNLPLIVRLQAPRFFVVGDTTTISAVMNNNTNQAITVKPALKAEGLTVVNENNAAPVTVSANTEARVDWTVRATRPGPVKLHVAGRSEQYADAMEKSFTCYEHGVERFLAKSGKVRGEDVRITLDIPKARRPASTRMKVQITSSLAVTMLDALPYLADYPYGCTEQTMSRFLPAVIVAQTLKNLNLNPEEAMH